MTPREKIAQALRKCVTDWPDMFLVFKKISVRTKPGIETVAMDQYFRLYFDPEWIDDKSLDDLAYVIKAECLGPVLGHPRRASRLIKGIEPEFHSSAYKAINEASDMVIHDIMRSQGQGFPDFVDDRKRLHTVDGSRMPTLESLEGYFLCVYEEEAEEEQSSEIEMPMPMSESGDDFDDSSGSSSGDSSDDSSGDSSGDGSGSDDSDQLNGHKSGSSGDGKPREWEDSEPQDTFGQERLDDGCQDEEMKEAIQDAVKKVANKGCGSSDVVRIVDKAMEVQFDPQATLQKVIASSIEMNSTGQDETTYRRPNHRKSFGGFISPSRVGSDPEVLVVIDTSGSMEQPDFELAYGMLDKCFQELGVEELRVVTGDDELKVDIRVACMSDVKLIGSGGTDMVRVCDQALKNDSEPQPDVIICITDGGTDWPNEPYDNCDFIAAITSDLSYHDKAHWLWEEVPEHVEDIWIRS